MCKLLVLCKQEYQSHCCPSGVKANCSLEIAFVLLFYQIYINILDGSYLHYSSNFFCLNDSYFRNILKIRIFQKLYFLGTNLSQITKLSNLLRSRLMKFVWSPSGVCTRDNHFNKNGCHIKFITS